MYVYGDILYINMCVCVCVCLAHMYCTYLAFTNLYILVLQASVLSPSTVKNLAMVVVVEEEVRCLYCGT